MILGLLLGTNSSDMVKSGKALVTIFEQERKFSSPAPLVSINQKTPGNHYILAFSGFKKYVFFYFIIQKCLEAHCVQVNAHSLGRFLFWFSPKFPGYSNCCSLLPLEPWLSLWVIWGWAFLSSYLMITGKLQTRK